MGHGIWRKFVLVLGAVALGVSGLAVSESASPEPAEAACASGTKSLGGTVQGEDGRYISSLIGVSIFKADGTKIGLDGCVHTAPGYSFVMKVNTYPQPGRGYILPGEGVTTTPYWDGVENWDLTKSWSQPNMPSNASYVWMEIYTGGIGSDPSNDRYGHSRRRPVPLSNNNVQIRQPLNCGLSENGVTGTTGVIKGRVFQDGQPVTPDKVIAFNTLPSQGNNGPIVGFNSLNDHSDDRFYVPSLSPGPYKLYVYKGSLLEIVEGINVGPCGQRTKDVSVRGPIPDIPAWAHDAIYWLLDNGHATGYPGGNFRPNNPITRAQMARMLYRTSGGTPTAGDCGNLTDVPAWAHDAICWLLDNGHATGYPDQTFGPDNPIRRAEASRMLYRIVGGTPSGGACGSLTDVPVWAHDAICWMVDNGHMNGYPDNTFQPNWDITRAQTANVLYNMFATP